ncbi:MAG: DUF5107 domain-containing protein [Candidatus Marinimicrobia bacterium]|nr:DUF5107 domain-containing protein [Candidatus Neomarinimicrobiota bacterium]
MQVEAWEEIVTIPTYEVGEKEKMPVFIENRVYQGSSGKVYPKPIIEKIFDEKKDKNWTALFIENNYIKIMVLPELGGRIQMAWDKVKQRHFVYYNSVIKPALVGLTGPWISGGIEFNWPQHHRPSTYEPTEYHIQKNADGSQTIWCSEIEEMFHTQARIGFTLHPDHAYLEIEARLYNGTKFPQTFLWWANPAVAVNDDWQAIFPPDVNAVFDHGKRDVSEFPIAKGEYYKVDYSGGVDISRYKNIPVPTSFMVAQSRYDFLGGYDHKAKVGLLHIADHHVAPGKKLWTWGTGDFGQAWYRNLTDDDGPYVELMCGVFTDNQPDFSWLAPGEEKSFKQYFLPFADLDGVKNATKDLILNFEVENSTAKIQVFSTSASSDLNIFLESSEKILFTETISICPENPYVRKISLPASPSKTNFTLKIEDSKGNLLLTYTPEKNQQEIPPAAKAAPTPDQIRSCEELYLAGLHIEQYRHGTFKAEEYYQEALTRDNKDIRNNNALGLVHLRKGNLTLAAQHFKQALERLTAYNPNPYTAEPYYHLGITNKYQFQINQAYANFYKACWNEEWQSQGYFELAKLSLRQKKYQQAHEHIEKAIEKNSFHHKAIHLKISILRKLGNKTAALKLCNSIIEENYFNFNIHFEKNLLEPVDLQSTYKKLIGDKVQPLIEYALDYADAGLLEEALDILALFNNFSSQTFPMAYYLQAWFYFQLTNLESAAKVCLLAEESKSDYCFPNRVEEMQALETALDINENSPKAHYYLGNYWYSKEEYHKALFHWEKSKQLDGNFSIVRRNLAIAYYNKFNDPETALGELEEAWRLDPHSGRVTMELDQLYKKMNFNYQHRLEFLDKNKSHVAFRDDLYLSKIELMNYSQQPELALQLLSQRKFHPWEGGEGKVTGQFLLAHTLLALREIKNNNHQKALKHLKATEKFPENLGEGKLPIACENDIHFLKGLIHTETGQMDKARRELKLAITGVFELSPAMYYNDPLPELVFYRGLAYLLLGNPTKAQEIFHQLVQYGDQHKDDHVVIDYFAVSLPDLMIWQDDLNKKNNLHCQYLIAMGNLGLGKTEDFDKNITKILKDNCYHQGAFVIQQLEKILIQKRVL